MKFKYRFKGKVNSQLVLRGMLFKVGSKIDFCVSETELDFVKKHCSVDKIIDLEPKAVPTPKPMLETKTENKVEEIKNDLRQKQTRNANKGKHKENI